MKACDMNDTRTILVLESEGQGRANDTGKGDSDGRKVVEGPVRGICELCRDQWYRKCTQT
jgi:hypothetical protein